jgi:hypothetical protein
MSDYDIPHIQTRNLEHQYNYARIIKTYPNILLLLKNKKDFGTCFRGIECAHCGSPGIFINGGVKTHTQLFYLRFYCKVCNIQTELTEAIEHILYTRISLEQHINIIKARYRSTGHKEVYRRKPPGRFNCIKDEQID